MPRARFALNASRSCMFLVLLLLSLSLGACAHVAAIVEGVAQGMAQQPPPQQPVEFEPATPSGFGGCPMKALYVHNSNSYPIRVDALQRSGKRFQASVVPFSRAFIAQIDQADLTLFWSSLRYQDDPGHQHQFYRAELLCQATCFEAVAHGHDTSLAVCGAPR